MLCKNDGSKNHARQDESFKMTVISRVITPFIGVVSRVITSKNHAGQDGTLKETNYK